MNAKKMLAQAAIAGALGLPGLALGVGASTASADPGQPCWAQNCMTNHPGDGQAQRGYGGDGRQSGDGGRRYQWRPDQGPEYQRPWDQRGIDDARFDHRPFDWQNQRVEPYWDPERGAWGFWFFGTWTPL